jgi:hypothetical protein
MRYTLFGFRNDSWKPWKMQDGLEVLVSEDFKTMTAENGDTLIYPRGNTAAPPSGRMPKGGYFFDTIIRQEEIDDSRLDPADNLEEFGLMPEEALDEVLICGTDFGTQTSSFCSVDTFRDLWFPYYKRVNDWIHENTRWKVMKHSCGSVERFMSSFIECGFDILNPVQCSAANMEPEHLKAEYGRDLVFWGGGVDTQRTLPFGTPAEVREQVLRRCEAFAPGGGFVFNTIHNVQARTPAENIVSAIDAVHEFNGID